MTSKEQDCTVTEITLRAGCALHMFRPMSVFHILPLFLLFNTTTRRLVIDPSWIRQISKSCASFYSLLLWIARQWPPKGVELLEGVGMALLEEVCNCGGGL